MIDLTSQFYDPRVKYNCSMCLDTGRMREDLGDGKSALAYCGYCMKWCPTCREWVRRKAHACGTEV